MVIYDEKGAIQEQDITFINIYALNIGAPKYIKYILKIKGEINSNSSNKFQYPNYSNEQIMQTEQSIRNKWP